MNRDARDVAGAILDFTGMDSNANRNPKTRHGRVGTHFLGEFSSRVYCETIETIRTNCCLLILLDGDRCDQGVDCMVTG